MNSKQLIHLVMRFLAPGTAREMERDGTLDSAQYMLVQDNKADVTFFVFSGLAALFAGLPAFEFRKVLGSSTIPMNLVFIRDIHRAFYHIAPDGQLNGLEFYERVIREQKETLGARHNVVMGASGGGAAALYFGTRCGLDQVIAFSPVTDLHPYVGWRNRLRTLFDIKKLLADPQAYIELFMLAYLVGPWLKRRVCAVTPDGRWPDMLHAFRDAGDARPRTTLIYGNTCWPDIDHARQFAPWPEVKHARVVSGRHNCGGDLKRRGELGPTVLREIEAALEDRFGNQTGGRPA